MNIDITAFLEEKRKNKLNIIDIRQKAQYDLGHIPTAKNIPHTNLLINPEYYLNKNELYYIYCQYGISSQNASNKLNSLGYKTISINGGYNSYQMKMPK